MSKSDKRSDIINDAQDLGNSGNTADAEVLRTDGETGGERPPWLPPEGYDPERDADIRYKLKHGKKRRLKKRKTASYMAGYGSILGLHKFYLGEPLKGVLCLLISFGPALIMASIVAGFSSLLSFLYIFFMVCTPFWIIMIVVGIIQSSSLSMMGDEEFNEKYNKDKIDF